MGLEANKHYKACQMEKKIRVNRYVFHVTYPSHRYSILNHGIRQSKKDYFNIPEAVYAHNSQLPTIFWYPMILDYTEPEGYDFWRIDTKLLGEQWYVDQVMLSTCKSAGYGTYDRLFIYTKAHVPAECLTLFTHQRPQEYSYTKEGVGHVRRINEFRKYQLIYDAGLGPKNEKK